MSPASPPTTGRMNSYHTASHPDDYIVDGMAGVVLFCIGAVAALMVLCLVKTPKDRNEAEANSQMNYKGRFHYPGPSSLPYTDESLIGLGLPIFPLTPPSTVSSSPVSFHGRTSTPYGSPYGTPSPKHSLAADLQAFSRRRTASTDFSSV